MASMDQKPTLPLEAVSALHRGNKIEAIKVVREQQGVDLKEAKHVLSSSCAPNLQSRQASLRCVHVLDKARYGGWPRSLVL